jgi:AraC-like DNA-binding protein
MPRHFHGQLELLIVLNGWIRERIGSRCHVACTRQLIWHLPTVPHEMVERSNDLDLRVVHFEPSLSIGVAETLIQSRRDGLCTLTPRIEGSAQRPFAGWLRGLGSLAAGSPVVEISTADWDALLEDCDRTFDDEWPSEDQTARLSRLLSTAWHATWRNRHCAQAHTLVELGCALLLEDGSLSRAELCRALDVSEGYLSRCFAAELGVSFVEQRARARLARFSALTSDKQCTVLRAGFEAGFGSYEQLFRTFQHFTGSGPRDYLQSGRARIASVTRREFENQP